MPRDVRVFELFGPGVNEPIPSFRRRGAKQILNMPELFEVLVDCGNKAPLKILLDLGQSGTLGGVIDIQAVSEPDAVLALNDDDSHFDANDMKGLFASPIAR